MANVKLASATCEDCGRQADRLVMVDQHGPRERFVCADCSNVAVTLRSYCRMCGYVHAGGVEHAKGAP